MSPRTGHATGRRGPAGEGRPGTGSPRPSPGTRGGWPRAGRRPARPGGQRTGAGRAAQMSLPLAAPPPPPPVAPLRLPPPSPRAAPRAPVARPGAAPSWVRQLAGLRVPVADVGAAAVAAGAFAAWALALTLLAG